MSAIPDDFEFVCCLTHDVDRPFKGLHQALYYGRDGDLGYHLRSALDGGRPYSQFRAIRRLEDELGVRSAFYFLDQPSPLDLADPATFLDAGNWIEALGRYDLRDPEIVAAMRTLHDRGWEVGHHGSLGSAGDRGRIVAEVERLEGILGAPITGGRQHHLDHERPETWRHQRAAGLRYDSSLGSSSSVGFDWGYDPLRPFDDDFLVLPLTIMDVALPDPGERFEDAWAACEDLLAEARENDAVMTVCFHPMYFNRREFPGYRRLYRRLIDRAIELGGWVGPPRDYHRWSVERGTDAATPAAPDP